MALLWRSTCGLRSALASAGSPVLGLVFADDPGDAAAAEFGAVLVGEQRVVVVGGLVEAVLGEVGAQQRCRVVAERDMAGLAAFAGQDGQGRGLQADVAHGEVGEFLHPGGGVVEDGEQGRVPAASPGGPVGLGEQTAGLPGGEVVHDRLGLLFGGDGEDVLAAGHPGRVLGLHPPVERADRCQPLVAGRDAVVPAGLKPVQEPGDRGGVDPIEGELVGRDGPLVPEVADQ
jgi:hypothetical protein